MSVFVDWLGHEIAVGDWVVYTSSSSLTGMNLGLVEYFGPPKNPNRKGRIIQIRIVNLTLNRVWSKGKLVTLLSSDGAYKSVTKYPEEMVSFDTEVEPLVERAILR